ncbi:ubiquitin conjugating enzyme E2-C, Ubc11 [Hyaloraphidium curvatum]|nr:ubiquitin conjugating enzyme E2-C, Ubc11 [Hyaloraphidium curvatum]
MSLQPSSANSPRPPRPAKPADPASVTKLLNRELMHLLATPPPGISAFPKDPDSLFVWSATVAGPPESPYEGLDLRLEMRFPGTYPIKAPEVAFQRGVWHPNVSLDGAICLDILKDKWSAVYNAEKVLISIQAMLAEPNNDSPLNPDAAALWDRDRGGEETRRMVRRKLEEAERGGK